MVLFPVFPSFWLLSVFCQFDKTVMLGSSEERWRNRKQQESSSVLELLVSWHLCFEQMIKAGSFPCACLLGFTHSVSWTKWNTLQLANYMLPHTLEYSCWSLLDQLGAPHVQILRQSQASLVTFSPGQNLVYKRYPHLDLLIRCAIFPQVGSVTFLALAFIH